MQLAWPFALIGAAVGAQLPAPFAAAVILALVLGLFGALVSNALPRLGDWQVAPMSPLVGAATGATLGFGLGGFGCAAVGLVAGIGFGLLALPPLVLITDAARRAQRLPPRSLLGRGQRRRVWLLALATSALATLLRPALANPWSHPAEAPLAQLCATGFMALAFFDSIMWIATTQSRPFTAGGPRSANPYRENAAPDRRSSEARMMALVAAVSLLYDALLVGIVAAAVLVSR